MQTATISAHEITPITPNRVAEVATAELEASIALLKDLDDLDWARPTDCAGWTVHDMTAHLVGQYQGLAKLGVYLRRHRRAHRRYPALSRLDADNRQQIDDLGGRPGPELVAMLAAIGPKAIRARATGRPLALGAHDRVVVTQVIADLGRASAGPAVLLELTGPAGGRWALGQGDPAATVRADTVDYLRALSGRNGHPSAEADGDHAAADAVTAARVVF